MMRRVIELPKYDWSIVCFIGYRHLMPMRYAMLFRILAATEIRYLKPTSI